MTPELAALVERLTVEAHTPIPAHPHTAVPGYLIDTPASIARRRAVLDDEDAWRCAPDDDQTLSTVRGRRFSGGKWRWESAS